MGALQIFIYQFDNLTQHGSQARTAWLPFIFMAVEILLAYKNGQDYRNIFGFYAAISKRIKDMKVIYALDEKRAINNSKLNFFPEDKIFLEINDQILVIEYSNIYIAPRSLFDYNKAKSIIEDFPEIKNQIIKAIDFSTTEIREENVNIILPNIHIYLEKDDTILSFLRNNKRNINIKIEKINNVIINRKISNKDIKSLLIIFHDEYSGNLDKNDIVNMELMLGCRPYLISADNAYDKTELKSCYLELANGANTKMMLDGFYDDYCNEKFFDRLEDQPNIVGLEITYFDGLVEHVKVPQQVEISQNFLDCNYNERGNMCIYV